MQSVMGFLNPLWGFVKRSLGSAYGFALAAESK